LILFTPEQFQHQNGRDCRMHASGTDGSPAFRAYTEALEKHRPMKAHCSIYPYMNASLRADPFDREVTQKRAAGLRECIADFPIPVFSTPGSRKTLSDGTLLGLSAASLLPPMRRPFLAP
jgi:hypothetical protein